MDDIKLYLAVKAQLEKADAEIAAQHLETENELIRQTLDDLATIMFLRLMPSMNPA